MACATTGSNTDTPLTKYDKNTTYFITDRDTGFGVTVYHSKYQFVPKSNAVAASCKSSLMAIAWQYADDKGKEIEPIEDQWIRVSMDRNGLTGITSCQANAIAKWKDSSASSKE
ncbi:hypothetical protein [Parelusimicrobium proximum]|uniref:hypothetical protein n=1 Tax=Parelusimicrobium proximum TaxID=3228953 RepID=UPI003D1730A3